MKQGLLLGLIIFGISIFIFGKKEKIAQENENVSQETALEQTADPVSLPPQKSQSEKTTGKESLPDTSNSTVFANRDSQHPAREKKLNQAKVTGDGPPSGEKKSISPGFDNTSYSFEDFKKIHPEIEFPDDGSGENKVNIITSKYNEPSVPFTQLTTNCPALAASKVPVNLRIDGNGSLIDAVPLGGSALPAEVRNCKFEGGPSTPFTTVFMPADLLEKIQTKVTADKISPTPSP
jgi:hypothetical protein